MTPKAKKQWFELVENFVVKVGIHKEDTYRMDETGFPLQDQAKEKVVGARGTKTQHWQDSKNVTAIVTICADGTVLSPTIIYKGKNL